MTTSNRARRTLVPGFLTIVTVAFAGACSDREKPSGKAAGATTTALRGSTTAVTAPQGTVPAGPSLCDRLAETAASEALGFPVRKSDDGTSVSCIYTSAEAAHVGSVLSVSASDAGDDPGQLLSAARSASSSFAALTGVGDAAYVATVNGLPQGALIVGRRQYSVLLSASPRMDPAAARTSLTRILRGIDASLRAG